MGTPIATKDSRYLCFAFPNVCDTLAGTAVVKIPYPSVGSLGDAATAESGVYAGGQPVITRSATISTTTGDEAGIPGTTKGPVEFTSASSSVFVNGEQVVRMFDSTRQNNANCVGMVLGGVPTVLVGD